MTVTVCGYLMLVNVGFYDFFPTLFSLVFVLYEIFE